MAIRTTVTSPPLRRIAGSIAAAALSAAACVTAAGAHGGVAHGDDHHAVTVWTSWPLSPGVLLGLVLAAAVYGAGLWRTPRDGRGAGWPALAFAGGLVALLAALQTPIEIAADRVFVVHQIEHMLLQIIGPMLIMVAAPQATLIRGLPAAARRFARTVIADSVLFAGLFRFLFHPALATVMFVAATWLWMVPRYHDAAILEAPAHYAWHATLVASGLIFFWRVFDPRPWPLGVSLPGRVAMLCVAAMAHILPGVYLSLKQNVLYTAYGAAGRLWDLDALTDERLGGLTMWIPGGMMFAAAALAVVHTAMRREDRDAARRNHAGAEASGIKADTFRGDRRPANRALAIGLAGFTVAVFLLAITAAILYELGLARHS
ncbi:MAG TPA: cytochrome c oxidase assembly protein [Alphaproteobacteria bacterium]|nr:cytochrome c oxidase assembly protein [Alphaproteobacteria bacterium]